MAGGGFGQIRSPAKYNRWDLSGILFLVSLFSWALASHGAHYGSAL
jgi:hypothetical protein